MKKEDNIHRDIGYRLKLARQERNLKGVDVSKQLYLHPSTISNFEKGEKRVAIEHLVKFSKLYNKPVAYFLQDFV